MILVSGSISHIMGSIPRESGDDPQVENSGGEPLQVFPARAGMIRSRLNRNTRLTGIPRESGDDPPVVVLVEVALEYSPRERG